MAAEKQIKISDLKHDERNANAHTADGMATLKKALKRNGAGRSILLSADNEIIAGNGVTEAARSAGIKNVRVIETDGSEIIAVKRTDIKSGSREFYDMALADNGIAQLNAAIDPLVVEALCEDFDILPEDVGLAVPEKKPGKEKEEKTVWVPDCLFASNNAYDIPTLLMHDKPVYVQLPFRGYGVEARSKQGVGTYHFYVDDYKFNALWDDPSKIINSGASAIVEPNISLYETTPISYGIFQIYRKRWLARFLQDYNIDVFVDLNVTEKFMPYNRLGIPLGYNAFFTRGYESRIGALEKELAIAAEIADRPDPNLIVYGGSKKVKAFCTANNLTFINNTTIDVEK
jgi:hypothetical protein